MKPRETVGKSIRPLILLTGIAALTASCRDKADSVMEKNGGHEESTQLVSPTLPSPESVTTEQDKELARSQDRYFEVHGVVDQGHGKPLSIEASQKFLQLLRESGRMTKEIETLKPPFTVISESETEGDASIFFLAIQDAHGKKVTIEDGFPTSSW